VSYPLPDQTYVPNPVADPRLMISYPGWMIGVVPDYAVAADDLAAGKRLLTVFTVDGETFHEVEADLNVHDVRMFRQDPSQRRVEISLTGRSDTVEARMQYGSGQECKHNYNQTITRLKLIVDSPLVAREIVRALAWFAAGGEEIAARECVKKIESAIEEYKKKVKS